MHTYFHLKGFFIGLILGIILILTLFCIFLFTYKNKILPNVFIQHIDVSGLTQEEATSLLKKNIKSSWNITFENETKEISISTSSATFGITPNIDTSVREAMNVGRSSSFTKNIISFVSSITDKVTVPLTVQHNPLAIQAWTTSFAKTVNTPGVEPSIRLKTSGNSNTLTIQKGVVGRELQLEELQALLTQTTNLDDTSIQISIASTSSVLNEEQAIKAMDRAKKLVKKSIEIVGPADTQEFLIDTDLVSLLSFPNGYNFSLLKDEIATLSANIDRPPKDAKLEIVDGKVKVFEAPETGRRLNTQSIERDLISTIQTLENTDEMIKRIDANVETTIPEITLDKTNSLGINERIGFSESLFFHSIPNRVFNVDLTASRLNNALIKPGDDISFNDIVGEVSGKTGYKPAYVISKGKTVLGDGGGVCQVSTTLFRASLNAGLPILERRGHSYRVGYYEQNSKPGIDATVYAPTTNLRIKNDTSGYILITTKVFPKEYRMQIELWGTSDGRVSKVFDEKLWDQVPPLPTIYQDDPTLPPGAVKQVDWAAWGAKASFHYTVERPTKDGSLEVLQDKVFKTVYQPWANVYLRGI